MRVVSRSGESLVGATRAVILLGVLLIRPDEIVPATQLIDEMWGGARPARADAALHGYMSRVRKVLRQPDRPRGPIITRSPGYLLRLGNDEVDFHEFLRLTNQGRGQLRAGEAEQGAASLSRALELWRGPAFGGIRGGPTMQGLVAWLNAARTECVDLLVEAGRRLPAGDRPVPARGRADRSVLRGGNGAFTPLGLAGYRTNRHRVAPDPPLGTHAAHPAPWQA